MGDQDRAGLDQSRPRCSDRLPLISGADVHRHLVRGLLPGPHAAAQPVAFAFGGEAQPTDYARAIADGALLALIACLGLAQLAHETTPALAQLLFASHLFFGVAALPYRLLGAFIALAIGALGWP